MLLNIVGDQYTWSPTSSDQKTEKWHLKKKNKLIFKGRESKFRKWGGEGKQTERILHQIVYRNNEQEVVGYDSENKKVLGGYSQEAELELKRESMYVACACVYVTSFVPLQNWNANSAVKVLSKAFWLHF